MDAREGIFVGQRDDQIVPLGGDPLDRRRQESGRFELPEPSHVEIVDALSGGDPDLDPRA